MNIRELLALGRSRLDDARGGRLESEILLAHLLAVSRAWLFANPEQAVDAADLARFSELIERRNRGEPIAYLTGFREFWSLKLKVTADVLIPRHETELLVETALEFIPGQAPCRIADLGTGSGAIALAIAGERPRCEIHATESSRAALSVARENGRNLLPGRVQFHHGSWLSALDGTFRLIVSNPPYVAQQDPHLESGDCRFEPREALTPGGNGLTAIRHIAVHALEYLDSGGMLALEHGHDQGLQVRQLMEKSGYEQVQTRQDLQGLERVTSGRRPG
jgi:release factor glutamine methyltransferase